ncbi:TrbG/VirB9 family P-type conjugative transfer protein [Vibrio sp. SS-MA-C1-2]|uniref:TrbG/VirB9 family P-type conjugative transfer protein n=1 Tax=Vibrio sp. SS-MA-C1-2 TaxID=2908646 RepID=UPI001F43DDD4|nr:TrbG/VirB9 family P-type conjugative transfer protein [Vibrio sp. SS-MA-C1-2]UJF17249.1 TrbG/VirB9 family P-type conjugative transfer protein [Vibrio sp. SS-MA-C1-2]
MLNSAIKSLLLLIFVSSSAHTAVTPTPDFFDNRITMTTYNPSDVMLVRAAVGVTTLIQFESGEHISSSSSGIGIGDSEAWGIDVRGHNIFLKPIAASPETNLIVTTNKNRTYSFQLSLSRKPHYVVKIEYPKPPKPIITAPEKVLPCAGESLNFAYSKRGDMTLSPRYMWDNGRFTCLKFSQNLELPVAYQVASDGQESLINYHIEKDTMILQGVSTSFRLRLGQRILGLYSDTIITEGFNENASGSDKVREVIDE